MLFPLPLYWNLPKCLTHLHTFLHAVCVVVDVSYGYKLMFNVFITTRSMKDTFSDTCINVFLIFMSSDDKYSVLNIKL